MKSSIRWAVGLAAVLAAVPATGQEPQIQEMVAAVSQTEATAVVQDLVDFGTRYSGTPEGDAAVLYLRDRFASWGLDPELDPFAWNATTLLNVRADLPGWKYPDEIVLILAHHDSTSDDRFVNAPGADDDASGVAAVLETARVLSSYRFERTIRFLLTGGEEQGLLGSSHDAARSASEGENIVAVINHDMIGYWPTGWGRDVDVSGNPASAAVVDAYVQAAGDYVPGVPAHGRYDWGVCGDDQVSYASAGFPAIVVMDCYEAHLGQNGETTPHYHRTSDTPDSLDFFRMTEVVRATTAATAVLAVPIVRTLLRNDELLGRTANLEDALRPGSPAGGSATRLDPQDTGTGSTWNPDSPTVVDGDGVSMGEGAQGSFVFYETDRDEELRLERRDGNGDGIDDVLVTFTP